jgi:hypothetical protein
MMMLLAVVALVSLTHINSFGFNSKTRVATSSLHMSDAMVSEVAFPVIELIILDDEQIVTTSD